MTTTQSDPSQPPNTQPSKKRKSPSTSQTLTLRHPLWSYIHLQHTRPSLEPITAHLHLTSALSSFLGLHGTAIPFDILALQNRDIWLRVPAEDRSAFIAAVGGWTNGNGDGWRVMGWSSWNASALGRDAGLELFED